MRLKSVMGLRITVQGLHIAGFDKPLLTLHLMKTKSRYIYIYIIPNIYDVSLKVTLSDFS